MCDSSFHHSFESLRSRIFVDKCECELVTVGTDAGLAQYLPDLLFMVNHCYDAVSSLQSRDKSSETKVLKGTSDEHE